MFGVSTFSGVFPGDCPAGALQAGHNLADHSTWLMVKQHRWGFDHQNMGFSHSIIEQVVI
jgi:hypothetical protein